MGTAKVSIRGPWMHRFLIHLFTVLLVVLVYWTLGFLLDDTRQWEQPVFEAIRGEFVPKELAEEVDKLNTQTRALRIQEEQLRQQQANLQDSTGASQRTMQQMTELERLRLQKNEPASPANQQAILDAQQRFLANQRDYQLKAEELARLEQQQATLRESQSAAAEKLAAAERPAHEEYRRRMERWEMGVAAAKLAILLPLVFGSIWLIRAARGGKYVPLATAVGIAVAARTLVEMHEYFPAILFKYLLIGGALVATIYVLVKLVQMAARPQSAWLLKQYREAYEAFLCPVCEFPIRRGPLKYLAWTRSSIKQLHRQWCPTASESPDQPYTCPACGVKLYEECSSCHAIRHSLLPACCQCGEERELPPPVPSRDGASLPASNS